MSESMETVAVSRGDFEIGRRATALLNQMLGNPKHADAVEKVIQEINPQAQFPGRAVREAQYAPMHAELAKEREARGALEARIEAREAADRERDNRRAERDIETQLTEVKRRHGFSDDALDKVVQRMREKNNPDIDAAAAFVAQSMPRPAPAVGHDFLPAQVDNYGLASGDEAWSGLHKNPDAWMTKELRSIIHDPEFARLGNQ